LEFVITSKDITCSGATATLLVFNNENGFTPANIESICRIGKSTKKDNQNSGYIGEKVHLYDYWFKLSIWKPLSLLVEATFSKHCFVLNPFFVIVETRGHYFVGLTNN
jgi:hypothetical protein